MTYKKLLLFCLSLTLMTTGCSTLNGPSEAEINAEAAKAYNEVKSKSKISHNPEWNAMVQRVAKRIAASSGENFNWEYILIESPEVNAWCMPGGKIAVYTGIMPVLKTEGALAAVLGHEVAHATLRHGKAGYQRAIKGNMAGMLIGGAAVIGGQLLCKNSTCRTLTGLGGAAAGLAVTFFQRKYGRDDETQADKYGQIYMARAGYDPAEAIVLWDRMSAGKQGAAPPEFMSTHPSDTQRKANLRGWLSEAEQVYQQAPQKYGTGEKI
ncbi:MAG: M48 family metallopeptidase [Bdellovibrionaceae bacterium]|nr:M48 family metallopeptidase [Pseudobdellovibrionaceae bacterium]